MLIRALVIATLTYLNAAMYCSYPQWGIPGVGDDYRCDWEECEKRVERNCIRLGVFGGDRCKVSCAEDPSKGTETWECVSDEEWRRVTDHLHCGEEEDHEEPVIEIVDPDDLVD